MAECRPLSEQDQTAQAVAAHGAQAVAAHGTQQALVAQAGAAKGTRQVQTALLTQADRDPVAWV